MSTEPTRSPLHVDYVADAYCPNLQQAFERVTR